MKDFTTSEHITPILEEIKSRFLVHDESIITNYLKCIIALEDPATRQLYPVTPEKELYINNLEAYRAACKDINSFCEAAETYPGELDTWKSNEQNRVFLAVRDALIKEYSQK